MKKESGSAKPQDLVYHRALLGDAHEYSIMKQPIARYCQQNSPGIVAGPAIRRRGKNDGMEGFDQNTTKSFQQNDAGRTVANCGDVGWPLRQRQCQPGQQ